MTTVVIDDLRNLLPEHVPSSGLVVARTSQAALTVLASLSEVDTIYFDHDLGGDDTTRPVVAYLEERAFFGNPLPVRSCVVHTSNISGGDWIMAGLRAAGYAPVRVHSSEFFGM